jgi:hypothetical protein
MTLYDRRKQKPFWLVTDGRVYKPQPSGKALLRAASLLILVFLIAAALFVTWLAGWHF